MFPSQRMAAAKAFVTYELSISQLHKNQERIEATMAQPEVLVPFAALEVHYMLFAGFMRRGQLLDGVGAIKDHRVHIVHGRNDTVCLPRAAARLRDALIAAEATRREGNRLHRRTKQLIISTFNQSFPAEMKRKALASFVARGE